MTSSAASVSSACSHSWHEHLFTEPCCKTLPLWQKVAHIAFHIFTLVIPLLIYRIFLLCKSQPSAVIAKRESYPEVGLEAIRFARQKLAENPQLEPFSIPQITQESTNREISLLRTLFRVKLREFSDTLAPRCMESRENPGVAWGDPAVIAEADQLMKISYAISCLTLEDLASSLHAQDSYPYFTYQTCPEIYHHLREACYWGMRHPFAHHYELIPNMPSFGQQIPEVHARSFYERDTVQSKWRALYNDYCQRLLDRTGGEARNCPLDSWIQQDDNLENFHPLSWNPTAESFPRWWGLSDP